MRTACVYIYIYIYIYIHSALAVCRARLPSLVRTRRACGGDLRISADRPSKRGLGLRTGMWEGTSGFLLLLLLLVPSASPDELRALRNATVVRRSPKSDQGSGDDLEWMPHSNFLLRPAARPDI